MRRYPVLRAVRARAASGLWSSHLSGGGRVVFMAEAESSRERTFLTLDRRSRLIFEIEVGNDGILYDRICEGELRSTNERCEFECYYRK